MATKKEKSEKIELTTREQDIVFMALSTLQSDALKAEKLGKDLKAEGIAREGSKFWKVLDELKQKFLTAPVESEDEEVEE